MSSVDLQAVVSGTQENRVEALRQVLDYPLKQRDPGGSRFWFLQPGADEDEAEDTCPIAVGFYSELDGLTDGEIKQFLTADEQQREISGHYTGRIIPNQPVMYLLLPETPLAQPGRGAGGEGRIAMILPTDGKLRQRQIQTFSWSDEDLQARLHRLKQATLARIYVMDLHGNTKKKEVAPDSSKDDNVFDIQQGVSVCFLLKQLKGDHHAIDPRTINSRN